ncbi:beta-phosphoglucomutase [Petroclostridium xylanilyticum]|uniref:beta-phosphoglucomutase n=1 Tax=Petroclostridium xylanilyticum TaxID=1792311 RepID=UPI000B9913DE|nr:beta-phosphoglucomutase [Petroclostridium xylanilyticum]
MRKLKAAIFDLDGVIVDTAKYHFLAWKRLSEELGINFTIEDNERLKGVSRMRSLEIILEIGGIDLSEDVKAQLAEKKNEWYKEYINQMNESEILKGAREFILKLRERGVKTALGSASKNAKTILEKVGLSELFDVIVDGNVVSKAKPDPEVFIKAAEQLGIAPESCAVFEDAQAGIQAAKAAGMAAVGIGTKEVLKDADYIIAGLYEADVNLFN